MLFRTLIFPLLLLAPFSSLLANNESAFRDPDKDYRVYERKLLKHGTIRRTVREGCASAHKCAQLFNEELSLKATSWEEVLLQERFEAIRDGKFIKSSTGELKSPSWSYPDDGCYSRAAVVNRFAFHQFYPIPSKVFAFGNLAVNTPNSPRGRVSWWYHVAPVVEVNGKKYVLDPAIEFERPLELGDWLSAMGDPEKIKVSICKSGTYSPGDDCEKETDGLEFRGMKAQKHFLKLEERRSTYLGIED
jgi:hypothetical protein